MLQPVHLPTVNAIIRPFAPVWVGAFPPGLRSAAQRSAAHGRRRAAEPQQPRQHGVKPRELRHRVRRAAAARRRHVRALPGLQRLRRDHGFAILIDCHSMPSGSGGRADIVLGDRFGASCDAQLSAAVEMTLRTLGYRVTRNAPYAGGYTTSRYGRPQAGIHALQIELCRSLYMNEAEIAPRQPRFDRMRRRMTRLIGILCEIDWQSRMAGPEKKQPRLRAAE